MKTTCATLLLLLLPAVALARLGETYEQCVDRYGQPIEEESGLTIGSLKARGSVFQTESGWEIYAIFVDGRAIQVAYSRHPSRDLTADQTRQLLLENSSGEKWKDLPQGKTRIFWENSTGFAVQDLVSRQLIFTSRAYYDRLRAPQAVDPKTKPPAPDLP